MNLNQVTLSVTDLARSIAFYQKIGLTLIVNSSGKPYARFECPDGTATLSLHEDPARPKGPASTINLYFEVPNVMLRYQALKDAGICFEHEPLDQNWGWTEAWFHDPDGHRLCLFHAGKNRKHPPWRLENA